jgi:hypothetical protein
MFLILELDLRKEIVLTYMSQRVSIEIIKECFRVHESFFLFC